MECYRHYAFPSEYRGNIYSCCWTLGTVYRFPLTREGSSYKSHKEIFLQTTGEVGFAPVDLAVGPQGEMYVAIGGRGTRGSVFCVRYTGKLKPEEAAPKAETELDQVLTAPQPLAPHGRGRSGCRWRKMIEQTEVRKRYQIGITPNHKPFAPQKY